MMTSLRKFLFGDKAFVPFAENDVLIRSGRFYVRSIWTDYRRWRNCLFGWGYRRGVLKLSLYFNPTMPAGMFEALLMMAGDPEDMQMTFIPVEGMDLTGDPEELEKKLEAAIESGRSPWTYTTVVRNADDLNGIFDWFDKILADIEKHSDRLGGKLESGEQRLVKDLMGQLTERMATCGLNS